MSRINLDDNKTWGLQLGAKTSFANETVVPVTADVISADGPPVIFVNPGSALNMRLPSSDPAVVGSAKKGQIFIIINQNATNAVTLQTSAGAGFTVALTVAVSAATRVICTGSATLASGWVAW